MAEPHTLTIVDDEDQLVSRESELVLTFRSLQRGCHRPQGIVVNEKMV